MNNSYTVSLPFSKRIHFFSLVIILAWFVTHVPLSAQVQRPIELLNPVGGEIYAAGDTVQLEFKNLKNSRDTVAIELSLDNGKTWNFIEKIHKYPSDQPYRWIVPNVNSDKCLLRINKLTGDLGTGDSLLSFDAPGPTKYGSFIHNIFFAETKLLVGVVTNDSIVVYDIVNRQRLYSLSTGSYKIVYPHFAASDSLLIVPAYNSKGRGKVAIWDMITGELYKEFFFEAGRTLSENYGSYSADISPDRKTLLVANANLFSFIDIESEVWVDSIYAWKDYSELAYGAAYHPLGEQIAFGTLKKMFVLDAKTRDTLFSKAVPAGYLQYSSDGQYLLVNDYYNGTISKKSTNVYDTKTWKNVSGSGSLSSIAHGSISMKSMRFAFGENDPVHESFSDDGRSSWVKVFPATRTVYYSYDSSSNSGGPIAVSSDGNLAAVFNTNGKVVVWDISRFPSDTTESTFTIGTAGGALPVVVHHDVGTVRTGQTADTVIMEFARNIGSAPIEISEVVIVSGHTNDFTITSGNGSTTIGPNQSSPLGIQFAPTDIGTRSVMVEVRTANGNVTAEIRGNGWNGVTAVPVVAESRSSLSMTVQPNPVSTMVTLGYTLNSPSPVVLSIYDMRGEMIDQLELGEKSEGPNSLTYTTSNLQSGMYRFELTADSQQGGSTVIVVH